MSGHVPGRTDLSIPLALLRAPYPNDSPLFGCGTSHDRLWLEITSPSFSLSSALVPSLFPSWILSAFEPSTTRTPLVDDTNKMKSASSTGFQTRLPPIRSLDIARYLDPSATSLRRVNANSAPAALAARLPQRSTRPREEVGKRVIVREAKPSSRVGMKLTTRVCVPWSVWPLSNLNRNSLIRIC